MSFCVGSLCRIPTLMVAVVLLIGDVSLADESPNEQPVAKGAPEIGGPEKTDPEKADPVLEGHSYHGDAFNEGPRQEAYPITGTGQVTFEVSSRTPGVRQFIEQGIGQLHGFWYFEAERSFRHAAMLDAECAIAYWGMALANENNQSRAKEFIEQAVALGETASPRESLYIYALRDWLTSKAKKKTRAQKYLMAMTELAEQYPEDLEAQAFRGLAMYRHRGELKLSYEEVEAALQAVLAKNPLHPVHHYRIHLWDYKSPQNALDSARACGESAEGIAHMWHMPGHIYSRLHRYGDAVWQQEASSRVDHAHMMRDCVLPDQIHNFAHNNEWLIRNLMYLGRHRDAEDLARNMISLPRHPKYNKLSDRRSAYYGRQRLFEVLYRYEHWRGMIAACEGSVLEPTDMEREQIRRLRYLGVARARCGETAWAEVALSDLQRQLDSCDTEREELKEKEEERKREKKKDKNADRKYKDKKRDLDKRIRQLESAVADIRGQMAWFAGDYAQAVIELQKVNENKDDLLIASARADSGNAKQAIKDVQKLIRARQNQILPQAALVELLSRYGETENLRQEFERLRGMSASVQLGSPVFDRVNRIAADLGYTDDWRGTFEHPSDFGDRPALGSLGPFRWQPMPAPNWELPDSYGFQVPFSSFSGRPVVVVFFLGHGCLHCAEQLAALMPKADEFRAAGIDLVAISSDDLEGLQKSVKDYGTDINVDLLSDEHLTAFRDYRAFDDFENVVLHGTFLIDAQGLVRWQDISYEPFMDIEFLLKESQRLLAQKVDDLSSIPARQLAASHVVRKVVTATPSSPPHERLLQHNHINGRQLERLRNGALVLAGQDVPAAAMQRFARLARKGRSHVAVLRLPSERDPALTDRVIVELQRFGLESVSVVRAGQGIQDDDRVSQALAGASGVWLSGDPTQVIGQRTRGMIDGGLRRVIRQAGVVGGSDFASRWLADKFLSADVTFSDEHPLTARRHDRLFIELLGAAAITIEDAVGAVSGESISLAGEMLRADDLFDFRTGRRVFSD